jgi:hypothetical protein
LTTSWSKWLMTPHPTASVDELLAEVVNRPAWHRDAECRGPGTEGYIILRPQGAHAGRTGAVRSVRWRGSASSTRSRTRTSSGCGAG